ncbi:hypothetical protein F4859DRAFT_198961 [Xylaria cf. heliscus]|nr:hypothetical protein F4859DRAFT_198961 [Xylaria cf. heliscus]
MQSLVLLTSLLLGATATPVKQGATTQAKIKNFAAETNPDSDGAWMGFDLEMPGLDIIRCEYTDDTSDSKLPSVPQVACENSAARWQFNEDPALPGGEGTYRLVIVYLLPSGEGMSGFHEWDPSEFPSVLVGSSNETYYKGPTEFTVDLS